MTDEKQRLKRDMCPPQPTHHDDYRMHLKLSDLFYLSAHPKIMYPLVLNEGGKRSDDGLGN